MADNPAVLLIHGFPLGSVLWRHQVDALGTFRTIAPDLAGFGSRPSDVNRPHSIARFADDMIAILDEAEIDQAIVCGLSMGGYVAFDVYRRFPGRVRALALISTRAEADSSAGKSARDDMARMVTQKGAPGLVDAMLAMLLGVAPTAEALAETRAMILSASIDGVIGALLSMRDRVDSIPILAKIDVPTLVLAGAEDQLIPVTASQTIAAGVSGAVLEIVPKAGHLVPLERPKEFNRAMLSFLKRVT